MAFRRPPTNSLPRSEGFCKAMRYFDPRPNASRLARGSPALYGCGANQIREFAMTEGVMEKVRLGRTDLMVTSVCFGTSGLGDMPDTYGYGVDEARARATLHAIFDGPANFIDTSRNYGMRRTEERIGAPIRERGGLPAGLGVPPTADSAF